MKRLIALLCLLVLPARAADITSQEGPASAVRAFYAVYAEQHAQAGGIPDATGRLRYSAVLSPRLNAALAQAAAAQARLSARAKTNVKNAVPPMLEGDIFSSLFEGATSWQVGECRGDAKIARCAVTLAHADPARPGPVGAGQRAEKPAQWRDTVVVASTPAGWKVDDVIYDAGFALGNTGSLDDMLAMVVAANP